MIDIKSDEDLVSVIDELRHRLKCARPHSPMRADFDEMLCTFITVWHLDGDPHCFASMPEKET